MWLACAAAVGFGSGARAFEVLDYGIYCPSPPEGERLDAPGTELGWVRQGFRAGTFDVPGTFVPAEKNLGFGVIYRTPDDLPPNTVGTLIITHPPMGAAGLTRQTHEVPLMPGTIEAVTWVFEFDYERIEGIWTRTLEVQGETVWSVTFNVAPAGANPWVNERCFPEGAIS